MFFLKIFYSVKYNYSFFSTKTYLIDVKAAKIKKKLIQSAQNMVFCIPNYRDRGIPKIRDIDNLKKRN